MSVITLTLNPAFDVHAQCEDFQKDRENLALFPRKTAGGKGINIARALLSLGYTSRNIALLAEENAAEFSSAARADGVRLDSITLPGRIRENLTLHTSGGKETRISFEGFSADDSVIDRVEELLPDVLSDCFITFTGRTPSGISPEKTLSFLTELQKRGAKIIADSRSLSLSQILSLKPYLIKPNAEEVSMYLNKPLSSSLADAISAAAYFHRAGVAKAVVSLGKDGAVLASDEGIFKTEVPPVDVLSTIGAGDSSVAGFIVAKERGLSDADALHLMSACGTAACLSPGTEPPREEDICKVLKNTSVMKI